MASDRGSDDDELMTMLHGQLTTHGLRQHRQQLHVVVIGPSRDSKKEELIQDGGKSKPEILVP